MSNLRTVASAQELWQLCKVLNAWPQVKDVFTNKDIADIEDFLTSTPLGIRFSNGPLAEFMRDNGVRGREEMELTHPRWLDDRTYVLQMIKLYLKQGYEVDDALVEQTQKQQKSQEQEQQAEQGQNQEKAQKQKQAKGDVVACNGAGRQPEPAATARTATTAAVNAAANAAAGDSTDVVAAAAASAAATATLSLQILEDTSKPQ